MGLALVASRCGGNPEVVFEGETGFLVPFGDVSALTSALATLEKDETLRFRLAANAKASSMAFDFGRTVEETIALLAGN
jgi:glycosyltransferase involved in cell wall biosynthesis